MLIAGIIFQAPWKVIALLLVFLLACTVLPRPFRKWFWLSVGIVVLVLAFWVFLPDRGDWQPYRHDFDKALVALNDEYAIPDEENAAAIYNELFENRKREDFLPASVDANVCDLALSQPWLREDHPDLARWLQSQDETIAMIIEASKVEKCKFHIDANSLKSFLSPSDRPHLGAMRKVALLLVCAANNDLAEKRTVEALEKQIALLRMSEHLRQQPLAIDMLTGMACQVLGLRQINSFLVTGIPAEQHLSKTEAVISGIEHEWETDWARIAESEKISFMKGYFWLLYETNVEGRIRITATDFFLYIKAVGQQDAPYWVTKLAKAERILTWFFFPQTPKRAAKIVKETLRKYGTVQDLDSRYRRRSGLSSVASLKFNFSYMINSLLEQNIYSMHDFFVRLKSEKRATGIIIALRRYKNEHSNWPHSLDDIRKLTSSENLVDPINRSSFVYKLTDDSFS
ncbi:MAG: hypothetical protein ACYTEQ_29925 [Planctomycetota bacterium]